MILVLTYYSFAIILGLLINLIFNLMYTLSFASVPARELEAETLDGLITLYALDIRENGGCDIEGIFFEDDIAGINIQRNLSDDEIYEIDLKAHREAFDSREVCIDDFDSKTSLRQLKGDL